MKTMEIKLDREGTMGSHGTPEDAESFRAKVEEVLGEMYPDVEITVGLISGGSSYDLTPIIDGNYEECVWPETGVSGIIGRIFDGDYGTW